MKGISNVVTMNIFWIIFAVVAIVGIFAIGMFIFGIVQPIDIDVEDSGVSFDGETGMACLDADPSKTGCRKCLTNPVIGTCKSEQFIDVEEKFGSVFVEEAKVCAISTENSQITFKITYDDNKKREKIEKALIRQEKCTTFRFDSGVFLKEASAVTSSGSMDRFTLEFAVFKEVAS